MLSSGMTHLGPKCSKRVRCWDPVSGSSSTPCRCRRYWPPACPLVPRSVCVAWQDPALKGGHLIQLSLDSASSCVLRATALLSHPICVALLHTVLAPWPCIPWPGRTLVRSAGCHDDTALARCGLCRCNTTRLNWHVASLFQFQFIVSTLPFSITSEWLCPRVVVGQHVLCVLCM